MNLNPQQRISDGLDVELEPGRTVLDVVNERARLAHVAELARAAALEEAIGHGGEDLNWWAKLFVAGRRS